MKTTWIAFTPKCRNWRTKYTRMASGFALNLYFGVLIVETAVQS